MPPTDGNGNVVIKATGYVKLVIACFTLVGLIAGGAVTAATMIYARGVDAERHRAVDLARDVRMDTMSADIKKLSDEVRELKYVVERKEGH